MQEFTDTLNKDFLFEKHAGQWCSNCIVSCNIVTNKLDKQSKEKFKMSSPNKVPSIDDTLKFLQNRVQFLLDIDADKTD